MEPENKALQEKISASLYQLFPHEALAWIAACLLTTSQQVQVAAKPSGLSEEEKAKMDHQYRYKWWEIFWDKGLFSIGAVVLGALAAFGVNAWMDSRRREETVA